MTMFFFDPSGEGGGAHAAGPCLQAWQLCRGSGREMQGARSDPRMPVTPAGGPPLVLQAMRWSSKWAQQRFHQPAAACQ